MSDDDDRERCDTCHYKAPRSELRKLNTTGGRIAYFCRNCRERLRSEFDAEDGPDYSRLDGGETA